MKLALFVYALNNNMAAKPTKIFDINRSSRTDKVTDPDARAIMRYQYFEEKTEPLSQFAGFFPRWYLPSTTIASYDDLDVKVSETLALINTEKEIYIIF